MITHLLALASLAPWVAVLRNGKASAQVIPALADLPVNGGELTELVPAEEEPAAVDGGAEGESPETSAAEVVAAPPVTVFKKLSVIIAARNESPQVEKALRSLLVQSHPNYEIIFVNDRSTDETGQRAEQLQAEHPDKIRVVHVTELPEGWLGKCNALHTGAQEATGEYLLFTDADVEFEPTVLERTHRFAVREQADQVAVFPETLATGFWEKSMLNAFVLCFMLYFQPQRVQVKNSGKYVGIGAFNMVRTTMYKRVQGHALLRMHVVDDVALGKLIKFGGGTVRMLFGQCFVKVRWQESLAGTIRGLEKNFFAWTNYRAWLALLAVAGVWVMFIWPWIGLFVGPWSARAIALAAVVLQIVVAGASAVKNGFGGAQAVTAAPGGFFLSLAMLRSMWVTLRRGGIVWRDSFYSLKELRRFRL